MSPLREATTTGTTSDPVVSRVGLLARFGLDPAADDQEVESTYDRIGDFLDEAPSEIRGWADRRQQEADRIFSLLTGPESALVPPARTTAPAAAGAPAPAAAPAGTSNNRLLIGIIAVLGDGRRRLRRLLDGSPERAGRRLGRERELQPPRPAPRPRSTRPSWPR